MNLKTNFIFWQWDKADFRNFKNCFVSFFSSWK